MVNVGVEQVFAILLKTFPLALFLTLHEFLTAGCAQHISCGRLYGMVYTNAKQGCVSRSGGGDPFCVKAEARKFYRFRFHIGYFT